jgi:two-component system, OmpR family, sensor histidine kinase KdpD
MVKQIKYYPNFKHICRQIAVVMLLTLLATLLSFLIKHLGFNEVNIVILYILSVLLASRYTRGFIYGIFTSFIATLSFNFFFTEPVYTFTVYDKSYIFTFMIMLLASLFSSTLTSNLINAKERANVQEKQAQTLYGITSSLAKTRGIKEVIAVSIKSLSALFECEVTCVMTDEERNKLDTIRLLAGGEDFIYSELEPEQLDAFIAPYYSTPIIIQDNRICIFCLRNGLSNISQENLYLLESIYMQINIAIEREFLAKEKETAKIETLQERFKNNLLRAISHDLRTPLAVITGASEMLLHSLDKPEDISIAEEIFEDSIWLTRLVENILSLTRIQEGRLHIVTQLEAVEEIIAESIRRVQKYSPNHKIFVTIPDDVIFVYMDSKLIVQVLINLLDNAVKHTGPENEINVNVTLSSDKVWFEVSDDGTGIDKNDLNRLFDIFYLAANQRTDAKRGIGLGLAICKAIVNMHGGEIYASNNEMGGATFSFFLNR